MFWPTNRIGIRSSAIGLAKTELVTPSELKALQSYLDQGGTVIVDSPQSLRQDEYKQPHQTRLKPSAGKLVILDGDKSVAEIRDFVLAEIADSRPEVTLTEDNGTDHRGCYWRSMKQDDGSHLVSILNLGKHDAEITLGVKDEAAFSVTDMFTDKVLDSQVKLAPKGVVLLKIPSQD